MEGRRLFTAKMNFVPRVHYFLLGIEVSRMTVRKWTKNPMKTVIFDHARVLAPLYNCQPWTDQVATAVSFHWICWITTSYVAEIQSFWTAWALEANSGILMEHWIKRHVEHHRCPADNHLLLKGEVFFNFFHSFTLVFCSLLSAHRGARNSFESVCLVLVKKPHRIVKAEFYNAYAMQHIPHIEHYLGYLLCELWSYLAVCDSYYLLG